MKGVMANPAERKKREVYSGPPCPHYPHKYKTEAAHQAKLASRRRNHQRMMKCSTDYRIRAILRTIFQRCNDPRHTSYKWYGGRGIKTTLTFKQIKILWNRDGAGTMKKPSIDRAHRDDNYDFDKCKFIELAENVAKGTCKANRELISDPTLIAPCARCGKPIHKCGQSRHDVACISDAERLAQSRKVA